MPPFLNTLRRFLPLPQPEEDQFRTPDFNPQQAGQPRLLRRPPLPQPAQLPPSSPPLTGAISRPALPEPMTGPVPLASPMVPPMAMPNAARPSLTEPALTDYRGNRISDMEDFQRDQFVRQGGATDASGKFNVKRSGKDIALNALLGGLQGLASGSLGAGLGGAVGGGLGAAINPQGAREARFGAFEAPRIQAAMAKQQVQLKAEREMGMEDLRRRQIEAQIADEEAQAKQRMNPVIRPRDPREAFINVPGVGLYDINERGVRPGTQPPARPVTEPRPVPFGQGGLYDPGSKTFLREPNQPLERPTKPPREAYYAAEEVNNKKRDAEKAWRAAKQLPAGSEERTLAEEAARTAQADYNDAVTGLGEVYGDFYETGTGAQGWAYFKPRSMVSQRTTQGNAGQVTGGKGTVGPRILKGIAAKLGVDENEAARRLEADGYTIRRQ